MQIYPAIKATMGDWEYYIVRMKMREIANEIKFAHDLYEDNTLNDAIQRDLDEGRVKREIVNYLANREDRFFSSIVVASLGGSPTWVPILKDEAVVSEIFANAWSMRDSFGALAFDDAPKYYALDGQHRVAAIKSLVNQDAGVPPPLDFDRDFVSVIVIVREDHKNLDDTAWLQRYRKLFSSLNRYAKPTDRDTNIIMDEDDLFAILTRQLITDHEFFRAPGRQKDSFIVKTKGKNLLDKDCHFTTLQTLYDINENLMNTSERRKFLRGKGNWVDKQVRPPEEEIEDYYNELSNYWDAILETIPSLRNSPAEMRIAKQEDSDDDQGENHLLFRPIGQDLFARLVRDLLDSKFPDKGYASVNDMIEVLRPLAEISWDLHEVPWQNLILVQSHTGRWVIRSEQRKPAVELTYRILRWVLNLDSLDPVETDYLRTDWINLLYNDYGEEFIDAMWSAISQLHTKIVRTTI